MNEEEKKEIRDSLTELAKTFGKQKIKNKDHKEKLKTIGFKSNEMTNNALIVASLFVNAVEGDIRAISKWQELTQEEGGDDDDEIAEILKERKTNGKAGAVR